MLQRRKKDIQVWNEMRLMTELPYTNYSFNMHDDLAELFLISSLTIKELVWTHRHWLQASVAKQSNKLTVVLSMWSCRESMRRSPTGCHPALSSSAWARRRSSWSMELWRSWSLSSALSTCSCQVPACPISLSQRSPTSAVCLRMALATCWAFSSGVSSTENHRHKLHSSYAFTSVNLILDKFSERF